MDTYTPDRHEEDWSGYEPEAEAPAPRRVRRQFLNRRTAALAALVTCALGFYAGIRVEKSQLASSGATASIGSGAASGARAAARAGGFAGLSGRGGGGGAAGSGGAASAGAGAGPPGAFGGAGGANASFGTVSSVSGKTLYLTDTSGNTVKVKLTSSTKITKNQSVSRKAIHPGDTVIVTGAHSSGATTTAASVTDSGNRSSGSTSSGGSGSGGSGSGSAVGSLFSSGG
ncbi:MAG: hypothetical protein ACXVSE_00140 [Solirubrobacteraceae bacterium]